MNGPDRMSRLVEITEKYRHHSLCSDPIVWDEINWLCAKLRECENYLDYTVYVSPNESETKRLLLKSIRG